MNTQRKTTGSGQTGFWMRADCKLNARVVNGIMYRLQNANDAYIHTHILSAPMRREMYIQLLFRNGKLTQRGKRDANSAPCLGLTGFKASVFVPGWVNNTKLLRSKAQREQVVMSPSTYLNPPFSRLIGLKDGSASDTVKVFQMRRNGKQTP